MDAGITAAARALDYGDVIAALRFVTARSDPAALALRGIVMARLGELTAARTHLHRAARAFGADAHARARCTVARAEVELIDIDPARGAIAAALGCHFATPGKASREADLVVHASGSAAGLDTALTIAGFEAMVLEMSWYGTRIVPLELGGAFHSRRLTLRSSQVGAVPASRGQRWPLRRRLAFALSLLRDPVFDVLLSGETEFTALPALMPRLATSSAGFLCHTLRYD